jgi:hypothetical protein
MDIIQASQRYEAWLGERIPLIRADLERKHELMRDSPFALMRATFYRWAQTFPKVCATLMSAPEVLAPGDLHIENFGTWRDAEGRLVWGLNDLDEACRIPYTCDLTRLATSAYLAIDVDRLTMISKERVSKAILEGYRAGLQSGGRAFVLAEHHSALRIIASERLKQPHLFWERLEALPTWRGKVPSSAVKAILRLLPDRDMKYRLVHRASGLGSLGRRRFVALANWRGGNIAREAKELTESAWRWGRGRKANPAIHYQELLDTARRCPDPFVRVRGQWLVRRLAPDCSRIELSSLPSRPDAVRLLESMGWETANIHMGTCDAEVLGADLTMRGPGWLHAAAEEMAHSVHADWETWRKR